jgi:hypothetical protein
MTNYKELTDTIFNLQNEINSNSIKDKKWANNLQLYIQKINDLMKDTFQDSPKEIVNELLLVIHSIESIIKSIIKHDRDSMYLDEEKLFYLNESFDSKFEKLIREANSKLKHFLFLIKNKNNLQTHEYTAYKLPNNIFHKDINEIINETLNEISICFSNKCYIASICLCGKVIETALSAIYEIKTNKKSYYMKASALIIEVHAEYKDQEEIMRKLKIINSHRNRAILNNIRKPSDSESLGVISFTIDYLKTITGEINKFTPH